MIRLASSIVMTRLVVMIEFSNIGVIKLSRIRIIVYG